MIRSCVGRCGFRLGLACIAGAVTAGAVMAGAPGAKAPDVTPALVCFDCPRTFEQRIADDYAGADAVFAGEVRGLTVSTATQRRPQRHVVVDGAGRAISGELGPQPLDRNPPVRMTPDQLDAWRKAHRAFSFRPITGEEYRTYLQDQADRALAAVKRQLAGGR